MAQFAGIEHNNHNHTLRMKTTTDAFRMRAVLAAKYMGVANPSTNFAQLYRRDTALAMSQLFRQEASLPFPTS